MDKIKAVIFDLDGTIANTLPLCIAAFRTAIEPIANRKVTDEEIIATFGPSEEGTIISLAAAEYEKGVNDYLFAYNDLHHMCEAAFEEIPELLQTLKSKGIHISMVTGKGKHSTKISLDKFGLSDFFEQVETGIPTGPSKVMGINNILKNLPDLAKCEVIYVGDAPSDIDACKEVGIPIIAAAWAETAEPEKLIPLKPDELFYELVDFKGWLLERI